MERPSLPMPIVSVYMSRFMIISPGYPAALDSGISDGSMVSVRILISRRCFGHPTCRRSLTDLPKNMCSTNYIHRLSSESRAAMRPHENPRTFRLVKVYPGYQQNVMGYSATEYIGISVSGADDCV